MSAISCAALVVAVLLPGCGGGHRVHVSSTKARPQSPAPAATTTSATVPPPTAHAYWSYTRLIASLSGRTLALPGGAVHLDGALLECNGEGAPVGTGTARRWSRYTCTQTLFQNGADRDITFDVAIVSPAGLSISSPRYGAQ